VGGADPLGLSPKVTGRCRPSLAIVQMGTDAEQKRSKRIGFLAEIEQPDSDQNAYHG
jgi:hypothetical protein